MAALTLAATAGRSGYPANLWLPHAQIPALPDDPVPTAKPRIHREMGKSALNEPARAHHEPNPPCSG
jgi:hypothetical protein